jgi:putative transposase
MPRRKRFWELGRCYHIMFRGIDGKAIFVDDSDRCRFFLLLQEASELHEFRVHAFCLMSNHIHLLMEPLNNALGSGVHRFAMRYAQYFNQRHQRQGYVFQGRFRSILVEDGCYIRRLVRYIHLNPLEAGLARTPEDYPWSSYNAYFGRATYVWLETERVLSHFSTTHTIALTRFVEFMAAKADFTEDLKEIKRASRSGVYGSEEFTKAFVTEGYSEKKTIDKKYLIDTLLTEVCTRFGITDKQLLSSEKTRHVVDARAAFARTAQLLQGVSLGDVSSILCKRHGTISRLAARCMKCPKLQAIADELVFAFS